MASGAKRILLSPAASPRLQSVNKGMAVFPSPLRVAGEPKLPSCSTPTGLGNVSSATVKKRFAQSDEKPSRSKKKLFDFPRVDIPLTTNHLIDISSPVPYSLHFLLCYNQRSQLTLLIEENMKQFALKVIYCKCMTKSISPGCLSQQGKIQEIKKMGLTTLKNEQSGLS